MPITGYSNRVKSYSDVIAFPASKTAGPVQNIFSAVMAPFAGGPFGPARIMLSALDRTKVSRRGATPIGDSIYINVYVGWSDTSIYRGWTPRAYGDTWLKVATYTDLRYTAGALPIAQEYIIPLAEKMKIVATIPSADSMSPGHGARVDVEFQAFYAGADRANLLEKPYAASTYLLPATRTFGDSTLLTATFNTGTLNCGFSPSRVYAWIHADNRAAITTATAGHGSYAGMWQLKLQSSPDGVRWFDGDSFPNAMRPNGGTGIFLGAKEFIGTAGTGTWISTDLNTTTVQTLTGYPGKLNSYLRINAYGDTWCGLTAGHGIKVFMIAFE
jgi:hypothetical protein